MFCVSVTPWTSFINTDQLSKKTNKRILLWASEPQRHKIWKYQIPVGDQLASIAELIRAYLFTCHGLCQDHLEHGFLDPCANAGSRTGSSHWFINPRQTHWSKKGKGQHHGASPNNPTEFNCKKNKNNLKSPKSDKVQITQGPDTHERHTTKWPGQIKTHGLLHKRKESLTRSSWNQSGQGRQ